MYSYKIYHLHPAAEGHFMKGSFLIGLALKGNFWFKLNSENYMKMQNECIITDTNWNIFLGNSM